MYYLYLYYTINYVTIKLNLEFLESEYKKRRDLKKKYSILKLGLFGSFSKNINTNDSDIDILVKMEFKKGMYQNFCSLYKKLEEIFQKKVDLVDESMFQYKFKNPKV